MWGTKVPLDHQIATLTKDKMDAQLLGMTHEMYYVTKYNAEALIHASGSEVENLYGATTDTDETLKDYLGLALFQDYLSDEYLQVLYSETNVAKPKVPMPEIWLALYTVTPKDVHIDEHKLTDLAKVPDEQRLPMLAAIAKEIHDLCRTGAFELVPLPSQVKRNFITHSTQSQVLRRWNLRKAQGSLGSQRLPSTPWH